MAPDLSLADHLALAGEQLRLTASRIAGLDLTTADIAELADYLYALADHGHQIATVARTATEKDERARGVEADLDHAANLLDACMSFAGNVERELREYRAD